MARRTAPEARGHIVRWDARRIAAAFLLLAGLGLADPAEAGGKAALVAEAGTAPVSFTLKDSRGSSIALAALGGRLVLVHFFATWCAPCRRELPALDRLARRAGGVTVVAVSVSEPELRVMRFLKAAPLGFPVLLDTDGAVAKAWAVKALPTTVALDAGLRPHARATGEVDWDALGPEEIERIVTLETGGAGGLASAGD